MVRRTANDLKSKTQMHVGFLERSNSDFDKGAEEEAIRIAVSIRVLMHEPPPPPPPKPCSAPACSDHADQCTRPAGKSKPCLLSQLGILSTLNIVDLATPINPQNLIGNMALYMLQSQLKADGSVRGSYAPRLDPPPPGAGLTPFATWWNTDLETFHELRWSRAQMILTAANKEGGAHVDPRVTNAYERMIEPRAFVGSASEPRQPVEGNPILTSIRTISEEVVRSLHENWHLIE